MRNRLVVLYNNIYKILSNLPYLLVDMDPLWKFLMRHSDYAKYVILMPLHDLYILVAWWWAYWIIVSGTYILVVAFKYKKQPSWFDTGIFFLACWGFCLLIFTVCVYNTDH